MEADREMERKIYAQRETQKRRYVRKDYIEKYDIREKETQKEMTDKGENERQLGRYRRVHQKRWNTE